MDIMHLLSTENLGKIYEIVWETNFGKVHLGKWAFVQDPKKQMRLNAEKVH